MHSRAAIRKLADQARDEYWPSGEIPIDIDLVLERLGIDIVPVAHLRREVGVDACIAADLTCVYVDLDYARDERMNPRVRFSLAHELGHVVLHPHVFQAYRDHNPGSPLDWAIHVRSRFDTELLERESNEFAGCFLVPDRELRDRYDAIYPSVRARILQHGMDPDQMPPETLYGYMANAICRDFDVSAAVVAIRLNRMQPHSTGS